MRARWSDPPRGGWNGDEHGRERVISLLLGMFALQDAIMLAYLILLSALIWMAPPGPKADAAARVVFLSIAALVIGCFAGRGLTGLSPGFRSTFYRAVIVGVLVSNYLTLRDVLALVRPDAVDEALVRIDLRVFGVEPALWLERYNRRPIVEWFSFFYFSYFFISLAYMLKWVWWSRSARATTEFAIGTTLVFAVGQLGYVAVPGYGPIHHLGASFHSAVNGGFFWTCVERTVQAGGAMKDIFPSLHTAVPLWFTLFAHHQAGRDPRWRWAAFVTGFFSANIIISTMLLRWHYGVDVVAGLCLGVAAGLAAPRLAAIEEAWRHALGHGGPFSFDPESCAEVSGVRPRPSRSRGRLRSEAA